MKKNKLFLIISLILHLPVILSAVDSSHKEKLLNVDIDTAVSMALANNLNLQSEKVKQTGRTWAMVSSINVLYPKLSMSGTLGKWNETQEISGVVPVGPKQQGAYDYVVKFEEDLPEWALNTNFSLQWVLNAGLGHGVVYTIYEWQKGKITLEQAKKQIALNIKLMFYQLLIQKDELDVRKKSQDVSLNRYKRAQVEFDNGIIPEYQLLTIQLGYESHKPTILQLSSQFEQNILTFKQMVGIKKNVPVKLDGKIDFNEMNKINTDKLIMKGIENNLSFKSLKLQVKQLASQRDGFSLALLPSLIFGYTVDPAFQEDPMEDDWLADIDDDWKQTRGMFSITVQVPLGAYLPLSSEQMRVVQSQVALSSTKLVFDDLKQNLEINLQNSIMQLNTALETIKTLNLSAKVSKKALELAEIAYEAGAKSYRDVEEEEVKYRDSQVKLLNAKYGYIVALLNLEFLLNETINFE